jgi:multidrug efflux system membrane fusion protein
VLRGIGTVDPINSVLITSQVTGVLQSVAFVEGQDVKAGDLVAEIDPRPFQAQLDEAKAQLAKDQAALGNARQILGELRALPPGQVVSPQQVANQQASVNELAATVSLDQAAVELAGVQLGYTRIVSPIGGRTGFRLIDPGNLIPANDPTGIVRVNEIDPIEVIFTLPEEAVATVAAATAAAGRPLAVEVFGRGAATPTATGTLLLVDNEVDQQSGTVSLKAQMPNPTQALWPGQFVDVALLLRVETGAVVVPNAAVQRGPNGLFVYRVEADGTARLQPIQRGPTVGGVTVVARGIDAGDRIVVTGQYRVRDGVKVVDAAPPGAPVAATD